MPLLLLTTWKLDIATLWLELVHLFTNFGLRDIKITKYMKNWTMTQIIFLMNGTSCFHSSSGDNCSKQCQAWGNRLWWLMKTKNWSSQIFPRISLLFPVFETHHSTPHVQSSQYILFQYWISTGMKIKFSTIWFHFNQCLQLI